MKHIEYDYQVAVFQWAYFHRNKWPEINFMFAVINETRGISPQKGNRDRLQGKRSGVPDICLPVPRGTFHGLYIEMKSPTGKISENQKKYAIFLKSQGYFVALCNSPECATDTIKDYLNMEPFHTTERRETRKNGSNEQCFGVKGKAIPPTGQEF